MHGANTSNHAGLFSLETVAPPVVCMATLDATHEPAWAWKEALKRKPGRTKAQHNNARGRTTHLFISRCTSRSMCPANRSDQRYSATNYGTSSLDEHMSTELQQLHTSGKAHAPKACRHTRRMQMRE